MTGAMQNTWYIIRKREQEAVSYVEETASQWESEDQITYEFAVILAGEMIGTVSLWLEEADGVEIGWILNRNYWGHGYGTEAAEGSSSVYDGRTGDFFLYLLL